MNYSKSRRLGFRAGSFERNPKTNSPTKNATVIYTTILSVTMLLTPKAMGDVWESSLYLTGVGDRF